MSWNWQLPDWPKFRYDPDAVLTRERKLLLNLGHASAFLKTLNEEETHRFIVEILSQEGAESAKIEGELLDRESLQSSIRRHFGLSQGEKKMSPKEVGFAEMLCDVYRSFPQPLTHEQLWSWHQMLFEHDTKLEDIGRYRTHQEAMQIISHRYDRQRVYFEAPPSERVPREMAAFVEWFNASEGLGSVLARAAIAHVYFESIHPFEDGNGRIGRVLIEKVLSQGVGRPVLIALSRIFERRKKSYYSALGTCNQTLEAKEWVDFFADAVLEAHSDALQLLYFLIEKSKMLSALAGILNPRQEKALLKMFESGPEGFKGGLSAENYIAITKASRATATRDLAELVNLGALRRTGELRHTRYWLIRHKTP